MFTRIPTLVAVFLGVLAGSFATGSLRVDPTWTLRAAPQSAAPAPQSGMNDMMKMHEKMMADMKTAEARLDALVKTMNATTGDAKTNAVAAVVNELVAQQKAMHAHMNEMHKHMMGGRGMMMMKD